MSQGVFNYFMIILVTLSYMSNYPQSKGYYVLGGQKITLICNIDVPSQTVIWAVGGTVIYSYYAGGGAKGNVIYKSRILDHHGTEKDHQLDLFVNNNMDEGQHFKCQARLSALVFETGEIQLQTNYW